MTPAEVASLLDVSKKTLERWRMTGKGPKFCRVSKKTIRYPADLLATYLTAHTVSSTAA
ncbi:helix-turn-helix transcriptional regulator [Niveispirillum sp. KHB5.9]|uniref:helix-turn-helix transcriptional regulator n=1 Tax=Niveispirillum sp. KHB5.9 TaxID=3400269 RepID=UPI003A83BEA2